MGTGAVAIDNGNGDQGQQQEVGDESVRRASKETKAVGSVFQPLDPSMAAGGSLVTCGCSGDVGGSGANGGDIGPSGSPLRDSAKGKGVVTEEEETTEVPAEYREEDVMF